MPRTFYSSYLDGGMSAGPFYPLGFGTRADRVARTREAAARAVTPQLLERLRAQNEKLPPSPVRERNLAALGDHAAAVITGQQVGLFLGPLYSLYKAATAIAVARLLEAEAGVRCVPIFWLQTEDHDFAEIAGCCVPRGDGSLARLSLAAEEGLPARASVAARTIGSDVTAALEALDELLAELPHAGEVRALLGEHYRAGASWPGAFAGVAAQLFAGEGLIVINPREEVIARLAAPALERALVADEAIEQALAERAERLAEAGLGEQVRARPGMPLPFFHVGDARGPRHRLIRRGDHYAVEGCAETLTRAELVSLVANEPLRFSTSALLRPLVQDTLLPTAAYVGGPAEVNYFAQLAPLYPLFDLAPPLLAPRARFRLVPPATRKLLDGLGLHAGDVEQPREELARALARTVPAEPGDGGSDGNRDGGGDAGVPTRAWLAELEARLDTLAAAAPPGDAQLRRAVERTRATVVRAVGRLERRHARARLERDAVAAGRLDRVQRWLFPDGEPQERVHGLAHWAARVGPQALVAAVLNALDPLRPQPRDLEL